MIDHAAGTQLFFGTIFHTLIFQTQKCQQIFSLINSYQLHSEAPMREGWGDAGMGYEMKIAFCIQSSATVFLAYIG